VSVDLSLTAHANSSVHFEQRKKHVAKQVRVALLHGPCNAGACRFTYPLYVYVYGVCVWLGTVPIPFLLLMP